MSNYTDNRVSAQTEPLPSQLAERQRLHDRPRPSNDFVQQQLPAKRFKVSDSEADALMKSAFSQSGPDT